MLVIFNETGAKITEGKKAEDNIVDAKYEAQKLNDHPHEDIPSISNWCQFK